MINRFNHVGLSVANLERSISFYRDLLGMELVAQKAFAGEKYEAIMKLPGVSGNSALLRTNNFQVELFEFAHLEPRAADLERSVCDLGMSHFCIEVSNLDLVFEQLRSAGVKFHCPPLDFEGIAKATYARDPDGNVFELIELHRDGGE